MHDTRFAIPKGMTLRHQLNCGLKDANNCVMLVVIRSAQLGEESATIADIDVGVMF